jgi:hypothetical protein
MNSFLFSLLILFSSHVFAKAPLDRVFQCSENACNCDGKDCWIPDERTINDASTVVVTCPGKKSCGQKIVFELAEKYNCKASVQKMEGQEYIAIADCLILAKDGPEFCPINTNPEVIADLIKVCLEVPKSERARKEIKKLEPLKPNP